ncbi:MAG: glycosyltransferase family 39 protein [candidate division WOR-3 bacterium]
MKRLIIHFIIIIFLTINLANLKNLTLIDWDEGVFALQSGWIGSLGGEGKPFNFQTPPLFQILIALVFRLLGAKDWILPLISIIFSALTIYILFLFGKELYAEKIAIFSVILFISTEYFLFFSKSGLSDATFLFFFITALYFYYQGLMTGLTKNFLFSGIFTTLACYTKYTGPILILIFLITGFLRRGQFKKSHFFFVIILPILLFLPYLIIFAKVVTVTGIIQRHGRLLGINHLKFLFYLVRFAPLVFFTAIFYRIKDERDYFLLTSLVVFFFILGFYYHYFRLAYPLIPLFSLFSASFLYKFKKIRYYLLGLMFATNVVLGFDTIFYHSNVPKILGERARTFIKENNVKYVFAATPPNIIFYLGNKILIPEDHPGSKILADKIKFFKKQVLIRKDENLLKDHDCILFIFFTIFDTLKAELNSITINGKLLGTIEFVDAPVYYKDLFNPLKGKKQIYEIYLLSIKDLDSQSLRKLWELVFKPEITFLQIAN